MVKVLFKRKNQRYAIAMYDSRTNKIHEDFSLFEEGVEINPQPCIIDEYKRFKYLLDGWIVRGREEFKEKLRSVFIDGKEIEIKYYSKYEYSICRDLCNFVEFAACNDYVTFEEVLLEANADIGYNFEFMERAAELANVKPNRLISFGYYCRNTIYFLWWFMDFDVDQIKKLL